MLSIDQINEILQFWFPNDDYQTFWFKQSEEFDNLIKLKFMEYIKPYDIQEIISLNNKNYILGYIILFDQFTRNINRVNFIDVKFYTELADKLTNEWITKKYYLNSPINYNIFSLMPYRHSNDKIKYETIISILNELNIKDNLKDNKIYKRFYYQTMKRYNQN